jgi:ribosomal-protein-alanine N-acetyltransferase
MDVNIRRYHKRDRQSVLDITDRSFEGFCLEANMEQHFGTIAGTSWQKRKHDAIEYDLRYSSKHVFVAEIGGEVVGYVCTRLYSERMIGHIANMAVAPEHQDRGIGRMLMARALENFRDCGMRYARIETLERNERGRHLYPEMGFREVGRQIFYFRRL